MTMSQILYGLNTLSCARRVWKEGVAWRMLLSMLMSVMA